MLLAFVSLLSCLLESECLLGWQRAGWIRREIGQAAQQSSYARWMWTDGIVRLSRLSVEKEANQLIRLVASSSLAFRVGTRMATTIPTASSLLEPRQSFLLLIISILNTIILPPPFFSLSLSVLGLFHPFFPLSFACSR